MQHKSKTPHGFAVRAVLLWEFYNAEFAVKHNVNISVNQNRAARGAVCVRTNLFVCHHKLFAIKLKQ
jgi:hypothetical protein